MRKLASGLLVIALLGTAWSSSANDGYTYQSIGVPGQASSGLTVTVDSAELIEKTGSFQLRIVYTQKNNTTDKKINEGSFRLFFTDGTSEPQYGFFNSLFPSDVIAARSYTWEWVKGKEPWLIEWEDGFLASKPTASGLKWKIGSSYPAPSPTQSATPTPGQTGTPSAGTPKFNLFWSGNKLTVKVSDAPVGSVIQLKIGNKWYRSTKKEKESSFTYSTTANPSTVMSIHLNGELKDLVATPGFVESCQEMWKMFDGGLSPRSGQKNKGTKLKKTPTVHFVGAAANSELDTDKDGLVCER